MSGARPSRAGPGPAWGVYIASGVLASVILLGVSLPPHHGALLPAPAPAAPLQAARQIRFVELPHDDLAVLDGATGRIVALVPADQNGFLHGVAHGLAATRRHAGVDTARPYGLSLYDDGRLVLSDPSTDTSIDVEGFGPTNEATVLAFLARPARP